jgi:hypothetical protein
MKFIVPQQPQLQLFFVPTTNYYNDCSTYYNYNHYHYSGTYNYNYYKFNKYNYNYNNSNAVCKSFELISTENSASWLAETCLNEAAGGLILLSGTTVNTGCIFANTLELSGMTIVSQTICI